MCRESFDSKDKEVNFVLKDESQFSKLSCFNNLEIKMSLKEIPYLSETLVSLICSSIRLTALPKLPKTLVLLDCSYNEVRTLPELPETLTELKCSSNKLTDLPKLPETLTVLDCFENRLTALPKLPKRLTKLQIGKNQVTILPELPETLTELKCFNNKLTVLPKLPETLTTLSCQGNSFTNAPRKYPESLHFVMDDFDENDSDDDVFIENKCGLTAYKCNDYEDINEYLYNNDFDKKYESKRTDSRTRIRRKIERHIRDIDAKFNRSTRRFDKNEVLFRGVKHDIFKNKNVGDSVTMENYISTTTDIEVAIRFSEKKGCIYRLHVDPDVKFIKIEDYNINCINDDEKEVLLPRNLVMTYMGKGVVPYNIEDKLLESLEEIDMDNYSICSLSLNKYPNQLDIYLANVAKRTVDANFCIYLENSDDFDCSFESKNDHIAWELHITEMKPNDKMRLEKHIFGKKEYTERARKKILVDKGISFIEKKLTCPYDDGDGKRVGLTGVALPRYLILEYLGVEAETKLRLYKVTNPNEANLSDKTLMDTIHVVDVGISKQRRQ